MKIKGEIEIDVATKTVKVILENGSSCIGQYTIGLKRFLDDEISFLQRHIVKGE